MPVSKEKKRLFLRIVNLMDRCYLMLECKQEIVFSCCGDRVLHMLGAFSRPAIALCVRQKFAKFSRDKRENVFYNW